MDATEIHWGEIPYDGRGLELGDGVAAEDSGAATSVLCRPGPAQVRHSIPIFDHPQDERSP